MNLFEDFAEINKIDINNPEFDKPQKTHDWRNYVPFNWQKNWMQFTERERKIISVMCQMRADKEDYE